MIKWFDEIQTGDREIVGSKGYNLGILRSEGFNIPAGFVLTTEGLKNWNQETQKIVIDAFNSLENQRVAVRSSAINEDLEGMSFAGQYETKLNIRTEEILVLAIEEVMESFKNIRATAYKKDKEIEVSYPAIVIQEMVEAEVSGIMFTADPMTGIRDQMIINSSFGLGEGVVSGLVTPDQYTVNKKSGKIVNRDIFRKERGYFYADDGIQEQAIGESQQERESLSGDLIRKLFDLAVEVENFYQKPQDIEFAVKDNQLYLLQSRPITALYPLGNLKRDDKLRLYINFNQVMQGVKEPFTPMGCELWKKVYLGYATVMAGKKSYQKANYIRFAGNRVFIELTNLLSKKWLWKVISVNMKNKDLPFGDALDYIKEKYQKIFLQQGIKFRIPLSLYFYFIKQMKYYLRAMRNPEYAHKVCEEIGEEWVASVKVRLDGNMELNKLIEYTHQIGQEILEVPLKETMFISGIKLLPKLEKLIAKYYDGEMDIEAIKWALPYNKTTEMGLALNKLAGELDGEKYDKDHPLMQEFLQEYGHRGNLELDPGVPRWNEEREYLMELIKSYQQDQNYRKNLEMLAEQKQKAESKVEEIVERFREDHGSRLARKVEKILFNYRQTAGLREQPKFDIVRVIALLRKAWLKQGQIYSDKKLLENPEDIFYLYLEDLQSPEQWKKQVIKHREQYNFEMKRTRVPRILLNTGETIYTVRNIDKNAESLKGLSISPGVYEGTVRVMKRPSERINKGDILVTESTNPSWTPLFITAGALIMESGGPISHGAIVAREYGIPGVVGIPDITNILKTGMRVRVHGDSGLVEILDSI